MLVVLVSLTETGLFCELQPAIAMQSVRQVHNPEYFTVLTQFGTEGANLIT